SAQCAFYLACADNTTRAIKRSAPIRLICPMRDLFHGLPLTGRIRPLDRIKHALIHYAVLEVRSGILVLVNPSEQIQNRMSEGVLVPDYVAWRPPPRNVRMRRIGHHYVLESTVRAFLDV